MRCDYNCKDDSSTWECDACYQRKRRANLLKLIELGIIGEGKTVHFSDGTSEAVKKFVRNGDYKPISNIFPDFWFSRFGDENTVSSIQHTVEWFEGTVALSRGVDARKAIDDFLRKQ